MVAAGVQGLPTKVKSFRIVRTHEVGKEILLETYAYNEGRVYEYQTGIAPEHVASDSVKGVLGSMVERGIQRMYLPQILGGDFGDSHFQDWVRMRLSVEDIMHGIPTTTTTINKTFFPGHVVLNTSGQHSQKASSKKLLASSQPELEQPNQLELVNNRRATAPAASAGDLETPVQRRGESRKDFLRRRNAFYVKRGQRQRIQQMMTLQKEAESFEKRNVALRDSNRRLEGLLAQARLVVAIVNSNGGDVTATSRDSCT